ncbi:MAG: heavy-metal-associated domain-containing protein [Psychroflexus sp.]|nr:heavy-metal-associated domain-containing protein [Psychroflexus sp.]
MKHTYHIAGMTCKGCRSHVEQTLSKVEGVSNASVNLEKEEATIEMESHIPLEKFQEALKEDGGSYSISATQHSEKRAMKNSYYIGGMSCNGCQKHVEETLSNVKGVSKVSVDLENEQAEIEMEKHIPLEKFQQALKDDGGSYSISTTKPSEK